MFPFLFLHSSSFQFPVSHSITCHFFIIIPLLLQFPLLFLYSRFQFNCSPFPLFPVSFLSWFILSPVSPRWRNTFVTFFLHFFILLPFSTPFPHFVSGIETMYEWATLCHWVIHHYHNHNRLNNHSFFPSFPYLVLFYPFSTFLLSLLSLHDLYLLYYYWFYDLFFIYSFSSHHYRHNRCPATITSTIALIRLPSTATTNTTTTSSPRLEQHHRKKFLATHAEGI